MAPNASSCQCHAHSQHWAYLSTERRGDRLCADGQAKHWVTAQWEPLCFAVFLAGSFLHVACFFSQRICCFWFLVFLWVCEGPPPLPLSAGQPHTFQIFPMMLSFPLSAFLLLLIVAIREAPFEVEYWFLELQSNVMQSSLHLVYLFILRFCFCW